MPRYSLKRLLVIVTLIACGLGVLRGCYSFLTYFETGENVASVDWLPPSATNISYYRSYSFTAYEFDISEAKFKKWAQRWELRPIVEPFEVIRFSYSSSFPALGQDLTETEWDRLEALRYARVTNGLCYRYRQSNGGGVSVAYDRVIGRAYFQTSPR